MATDLVFTECQLPTEAQTIRFWPASVIDQDPGHPGLRGQFKSGRFHDESAKAWESRTVYVWRCVDVTAEGAAATALRRAIEAIDAAVVACARAGMGVPAARYLSEARQAIELTATGVNSQLGLDERRLQAIGGKKPDPDND